MAWALFWTIELYWIRGALFPRKHPQPRSLLQIVDHTKPLQARARCSHLFIQLSLGKTKSSTWLLNQKCPIYLFCREETWIHFGKQLKVYCFQWSSAAFVSLCTRSAHFVLENVWHARNRIVLTLCLQVACWGCLLHCQTKRASPFRSDYGWKLAASDPRKIGTLVLAQFCFLY